MIHPWTGTLANTKHQILGMRFCSTPDKSSLSRTSHSTYVSLYLLPTWGGPWPMCRSWLRLACYKCSIRGIKLIAMGRHLWRWTEVEGGILHIHGPLWNKLNTLGLVLFPIKGVPWSMNKFRLSLVWLKSISRYPVNNHGQNDSVVGWEG